MATVSLTTTRPRTTAPAPAEGDQRVVMAAVGWEGYEALLRVRGRRSRPRMVYLDGDVLFISPSYPHELFAERLGDVVKEIAVGMCLPFVRARSTTFRNRESRGGAEA